MQRGVGDFACTGGGVQRVHIHINSLTVEKANGLPADRRTEAKQSLWSAL